MAILLGIIHQGLIFSLVACAVFLTSRIINRDDLSVEGSFGLGGAICASMLASNISPQFAILAAAFAGIIVGLHTGFLHTKLMMNHLMAGLVSTTACFSFSLYIASANLVVADENTIFFLLPFSESTSQTILLTFIIFLFAFMIIKLLKSDYGLLLTATGENPSFVDRLGKSSSNFQIFGFAIANCLTAIAGSLFVQWSGFFSITGNIGTLITGLASLMIAELITKNFSLVIILSSLIYQSIFALTVFTGVPPVWNNLVKALTIIVLVFISQKTKSPYGENRA